MGLLGGRAFVAGHEWARDVGVALNFGARGAGVPAIMFEASEGNTPLIDGLSGAAPHPVANSLSQEVYRRMPNDTDLMVFKKAGVAGMNFAHIEGLTRYHTADDDAGSVSERTLQHHGDYALSLARRLDASGALGSADDVYFNLPGGLFVRYDAWLAAPLALAAALLCALLLFAGLRRGRLSAAGIAFGALAAVVSAAVSAGAVRVRVNDVSRAGFARRRGWTNEEVTAAQRAAPVRAGGTPRRRGARRVT